MIESRRAQELFSYLLLYRSRSHSRELLASKLWGDITPGQSRANFRKALHQLQQALPGVPLLLDKDWVQINPHAEIVLDVALLELIFAQVSGRPGESLSDEEAQQIAAAVACYRSDLLEDCYTDWCLFERERLQAIYLALLDKLLARCEAHGAFEAGMAYGSAILRYDRAHEQTHRRLMRLHALAGDRTTALRQFERCVTALREELDTEPTELTINLRNEIRANVLVAPPPASAPLAIERMVQNLRHTYDSLVEAQNQLHQQIAEIERLLIQFALVPLPEAQNPEP
ncbi:hypothetical protein EYB53_021775 [Candidatus Chloroploca sp. M-50]|uniref:Bacterial transcriptional activator domain-containing protein n=1 Tax=Candidatus Chloroploca mongolica TaxID=2528176 RepID=A0ABS4DFY6_9CHLR|nr:BTAD domain-containing putative transcriptional regulator [Candidatus Chloroploca mongolica]MBP1468356.1 hypothetical protein [Candidatus Chloroploca mongolica]